MGSEMCIRDSFYTIHRYIAARWYANKPYYSYYGSGILTLVFLVSLYYLSMHYWGNEAYIVIPVLTAMVIFSTLYHFFYYVKQCTTKYLIASLAASAIAISFYSLDSVFCNEMSYLQLHSFWHLFSSLSIFYFYLYLRSERNLILE